MHIEITLCYLSDTKLMEYCMLDNRLIIYHSIAEEIIGQTSLIIAYVTASIRTIQQ